MQRGIRSCISSCRKVFDVIILLLQTELIPTLAQNFWMGESDFVLHLGLSDPVYKRIVSLPACGYFFSICRAGGQLYDSVVHSDAFVSVDSKGQLYKELAQGSKWWSLTLQTSSQCFGWLLCFLVPQPLLPLDMNFFSVFALAHLALPEYVTAQKQPLLIFSLS